MPFMQSAHQALVMAAHNAHQGIIEAAGNPRPPAAPITPTGPGGFDTGLSNGYATVIKVIGLIVIVVGGVMAWKGRKSKIAENLGIAGNVALGLLIVAVGSALFVGSNKLGELGASFLGLV